MSLIEQFKVGDVVISITPDRMMGCRLEILEIDDHPFEYTKLKVRMMEAVALPAPEFWTSSKWVRKQ